MKTLKLKPNSNKPNNKTLPAFTIIEVVLVLAIAGLIFLMVFIALPALQRNQRDTQRKNDMSRILAQLKSYQANNKGKRVTDIMNYTGTVYGKWSDFEAAYLPEDEFKDPSTGERYKAILCKASGTADCWDDPEVGEFIYDVSGKCDGEKLVDNVAQSGNLYVVLTKLEGGGYYCASSESA